MSEHQLRPYSIRLFVPDGDPNSFKIIQKMNWTGMGLEVSKATWDVHKHRNEFDLAGVFVLIGQEEASGIPVLHVGQGDVVKESIDHQYKSKALWQKALVFVSSNGSLDRKHTTWLQWMLTNKLGDTGQYRIDNDLSANAPVLAEYEQADAQDFLNEVLNLFPFMNMHLCDKAEIPKAQTKEIEKPVNVEVTPEVVQNIEEPAQQPEASVHKPEEKVLNEPEEAVNEVEEVPEPIEVENYDTVIVPAKEDDFKKIFIEEDCWYPLAMDEQKSKAIKYIAAYQTAPVSAITYCAEVESIESYDGNGEYKLNFKFPAQKINPIESGGANSESLQEPQYTDLKTLLAADTVGDIFKGQKDSSLN